LPSWAQWWGRSKTPSNRRFPEHLIYAGWVSLQSLDQQPIAEASDSRTVRLVCPVPPVPARRALHAAASLSLFLAVRRLGPGGETTQSATYLPVRLAA